MKQSLSIIFILLIRISFSSNANGQEYKLTIDSLPQEGVPKGTVTQHVWDQRKVYLCSTRDYWVYVPAMFLKVEAEEMMMAWH